MTRQPTPTERDLAARIAELEKKSSQHSSASLKDVLFPVLPWQVVAAAGVGFLMFEASAYYFEAQQAAAQVKIAQAKAVLEGTVAGAMNQDGGQIQKLKAELARLQEEAAVAKNNADALSAKSGDLSMRAAQVEAELRAKKAKAAKLKLEADALNAQFGFGTLQQREERAKLFIAEMLARGKQTDAAFSQSWSGGRSRNLLDIECANNRFAKEIDCPERYWPKEAAAASNQVAATTAQAPVETAREATVNTLKLNLRSCAATSCGVVAQLRQGTRVAVQGDAGNGWVKLRVQGDDGETLDGFVNAKLLQFSKAAP